MPETIQLTLNEQQSKLLLLALEMLDSDLVAAVDNSGDIEIVRDLWNSILDSGDQAGFVEFQSGLWGEDR